MPDLQQIPKQQILVPGPSIRPVLRDLLENISMHRLGGWKLYWRSPQQHHPYQTIASDLVKLRIRRLCKEESQMQMDLPSLSVREGFPKEILQRWLVGRAATQIEP
jgi:hypothetical protein